MCNHILIFESIFLTFLIGRPSTILGRTENDYIYPKYKRMIDKMDQLPSHTHRGPKTKRVTKRPMERLERLMKFVKKAP